MTLAALPAAGQAHPAAQRIAPRPLLDLACGPAGAQGSEPAGGPAAGPDGVMRAGAGTGARAGLIDLSDLRIDGVAQRVSLTELAAVAERLAPAQDDPEVARVLVSLWDRLCARADLNRIDAVSHAVTVLAARDLSGPSDGVADHSEDRELLARRVAVSHLAAERRVSKAAVWREVGLAESLVALPSVRAVASQGLVERDKIQIIAAGAAALPPGRVTATVEQGLLAAVIDSGVRTGKNAVRRMLAPLLLSGQATPVAELARRHARVSFTSLGNGLAEMRVVDRSENIALIREAIRAGARTAAHLGQPGSSGQLRAGVMLGWACETVRTGKAPTLYGTQLPIEQDHGQPIRLHVRERATTGLVASPAGPTSWEIPGLGPLTPDQLDWLRDDPVMSSLVEFWPLLASDDIGYVKACGQEHQTHDPPGKMLRYLVLRDSGRCRAPGCDEDGEADDIHHATRFAATGRTTLDELMLLHAACHRVIHQGWQVTSLGDGAFVFTDPDANAYRSDPQGLRRG